MGAVSVICLVVCAFIIGTRAGDELDFLKGEIGSLGLENKFLRLRIEALDTLIKAGGSGSSDNDQPASPREADEESLNRMYDGRIRTMERRVTSLLRFVQFQKSNGHRLKQEINSALDGIQDTVDRATQRMSSFEDTVHNSLGDLKLRVVDVNVTAQTKPVPVGGVIHYSGIGSTCYGSDECLHPDYSAVCRQRRCQCEAGLSFDKESQSCFRSCDEYGDSFQSVPRYIIRGYNQRNATDVSLSECKKKCQQVTEFVCRSLDYFPAPYRKCFLSSATKPEVGDAWERSEMGHHYQRDCKYSSLP